MHLCTFHLRSQARHARGQGMASLETQHIWPLSVLPMTGRMRMSVCCAHACCAPLAHGYDTQGPGVEAACAQAAPCQPSAHAHCASPSASEHVPPCRHGSARQGRGSSQRSPRQPSPAIRAELTLTNDTGGQYYISSVCEYPEHSCAESASHAGRGSPRTARARESVVALLAGLHALTARR